MAVLYCFLSKEVGEGAAPARGGESQPGARLTCRPPQVQAELLRSWHRWRAGEALREERQGGSHQALARPTSSAATEKLLLSQGHDPSHHPSGEPPAAGSPPAWAQSAL